MSSKIWKIQNLGTADAHKIKFNFDSMYFLIKFIPWKKFIENYNIYVENLDTNKKYEMIIHYPYNYDEDMSADKGFAKVYLTKSLNALDFCLFFFTIDSNGYILMYHYQFGYSLLIYNFKKNEDNDDRIYANNTKFMPYQMLINNYLDNTELIEILDQCHSKSILLGGRTLTEKFCKEEGWNGK